MVVNGSPLVIAGRIVSQGDTLYHMSFQAWGQIVGFDGQAAKFQVTGANGNQRILYVQNGGLVNGVRQLYWHAPLVLDVPTTDITRMQNVVNLLVQEGLLG